MNEHRALTNMRKVVREMMAGTGGFTNAQTKKLL